MCGRTGFFQDQQFLTNIAQILGSIDHRLSFHPSYNIAPTQPIAALLNNGSYEYTHFGLIPHWAKEKGRYSINARSETLLDKPMFSKPFRQRRCLIPVNGFYEWKRSGKNKLPYWIHPNRVDYFALAGVWERWADPKSGKIVTSSAIITTEPNAIMKTVHDRMPVILPPEKWKQWLDPHRQQVDELTPLPTPYDNESMRLHEVSTYVNSPSHNDSRCIEPMRTTLF